MGGLAFVGSIIVASGLDCCSAQLLNNETPPFFVLNFGALALGSYLMGEGPWAVGIPTSIRRRGHLRVGYLVRLGP